MNTAFLLAAGFGTRLRPLTTLRPKPLVPVCGVPMIDYSLALCRLHGHRRVIVNAHYLADSIEAHVAGVTDLEVTVSREEPEVLGTGGGLAAVADRLAERFVVVNADVITDVDLTALLEAVPEGGAALALREGGPEYGAVPVDATGTVVGLRKARILGEGTVDTSRHFTGLHAVDRRVLARIPQGFSDVIDPTYLGLLAERRLRAVEHEGTWLDIGNPEVYLAANLRLLEGGLGLPLDPHLHAAWARDASGRELGDPLPGVEVAGPFWIGPGAQVAPGTRIERSIVGPSAVVAPGARLREAVVWDGVRVEGEVTGVVAAARGDEPPRGPGGRGGRSGDRPG